MKVKILFLFFVFSLGITSSLDFRINATLNDNFASLILETNSSSSSDLDSNDVIFISPPNNYSVLYSNVSGDRLVVDSWNSSENKSRNLSLVFFADENYSGTLTLNWLSSSLGGAGWRYFFNLKDYGANASMSSLVSSNLINSSSLSSFSVSNSSSVRFFQLESYYSVCGDGELTGYGSWKDCDGTNFSGETCDSIFGVTGDSGDLSCSDSCSFVFSGCENFCGNDLVGSNESCDGTNFSGQTCQSLGYDGGSLSCNDCSLIVSGCYNNPPSSGSSPSGGSSSIGSGSGCVNECTPGERRCIGNNSYQVCGKFRNNSCFYWGDSVNCFGEGSSCFEGICIGCKEDSDCGEGFCISGRCEVDCNKSCSELGIQCGKKLVCGEILDCGLCENGFCNRGFCSDLPSSALKISDSNCVPNYICSPWSECKVSFDSTSLLLEKSWFGGSKERLCFDSNECYSTVNEKEPCSLEIKTFSKNVTICGISYTEIYEEGTEILLVRKRNSKSNNLRLVELFLLPGEMNCGEEVQENEISLVQKIFFLFDLRGFWRLFL